MIVNRLLANDTSTAKEACEGETWTDEEYVTYVIIINFISVMPF